MECKCTNKYALGTGGPYMCGCSGDPVKKEEKKQICCVCSRDCGYEKTIYTPLPGRFICESCRLTITRHIVSDLNMLGLNIHL